MAPPAEMTSEEGYLGATRRSAITVVIVYASWCGPRKAIEPFFAQLAEENPEVTFLRVNGETCTPLKKRLKIEVYPTLIFYIEGDRVSSLMGAQPDELTDRLRDVREMHRGSQVLAREAFVLAKATFNQLMLKSDSDLKRAALRDLLHVTLIHGRGPDFLALCRTALEELRALCTHREPNTTDFISELSFTYEKATGIMLAPSDRTTANVSCVRDNTPALGQTQPVNQWTILNELSTHSAANARDPNYRKGDSLLVAAARSGSIEKLELLVEFGSPLTVKNVCGQTALHVAGALGRVLIAAYLVEKEPALLWQVDDVGRLAAHYSAWFAQLDACRFFYSKLTPVVGPHPLESGAIPDPRVYDLFGKNPYHYAAEYLCSRMHPSMVTASGRNVTGMPGEFLGAKEMGYDEDRILIQTTFNGSFVFTTGSVLVDGAQSALVALPQALLGNPIKAAVRAFWP